MILLLDETRDNEIAITSNVAYVEITAEVYQFSTSCPGQAVRFDVQIPLTVYQMVAGAENGAFRLYLDGTDFNPNGKQWGGMLITNGGAWATAAGIPTDGRVSCSFNYVIHDAGDHVIRVQYAGSKTYTIGTLRSRRTVQVVAYN